MKRKDIAAILFLLVAVLELITEIYAMHKLNMVVKPLLMISLAIYFIFSVEKKSSIAFLVVVALMFSWFGDVFLLFQHLSSIYFVLGLLSFLLAQATYIYIFRKTSSKFKPKLFTYSTGFLLILYGSLLLLLMWPSLGAMEMPVAVYTGVIIIMGLSSLFRQAAGASYILVGTMLFITSDSMIAINKFYNPIDGARFWIMLTYILAQYLIVAGMIKYFSGSTK